MLQHHGHGRLARQEHRRPAQLGGHHLGLVRGRLQPRASPTPTARTGCNRSHTSAVTGATKADYIPHHEPFQYYARTANPTHARPTVDGHDRLQGDAANHQYDIQDFFAAVKSGNFPAVSYLKASGYQDAHAGYSDPLDEQTFVTEVVNFLEQQPDWNNTAVIIAYDDSDGWYDHQFAKAGNASFDSRRRSAHRHGACGTKGTTAQAGGVAGKGASTAVAVLACASPSS